MTRSKINVNISVVMPGMEILPGKCCFKLESGFFPQENSVSVVLKLLKLGFQIQIK